MTPSELISRLKLDLGLYALTIPFPNGEEFFMEILRLKTIPVFSIYLPDKFVLRNQYIQDWQRDDITTIDQAVYVMPNVFYGRKIMGVNSIRDRRNFAAGMYSAQGIGSYFDMMQGIADVNLHSATTQSPTILFEPPNRIRVTSLNQYSTNIDIEVLLEHTENLATITPTSAEEFYRLALLDVKMALYVAMEHYNELNTAHGTISLGIARWESAEEQRTALLEEWNREYHLNFNPVWYG